VALVGWQSDTRAPAAPVLVRAALALNVFCIIEPLVGVGWQWALAASNDRSISAHRYFLLGSSLWLVYALDRWLDARSGRPITTRHAFFARQRERLVVPWCAVLFGSVALALVTLTHDEWLACAALLALAALYLFAVHRLGLPPSLKKVGVAIIFALGAGVFLWPTASDPQSLAFGQLILAALAACNLAAITAFESRQSARLRPRVARMCLSLGAALVATSWLLPRGLFVLFFASAGSLLGLGALLSRAKPVEPELGHALSDALLLVPVLPWL
jgi:hypothetical protein